MNEAERPHKNRDAHPTANWVLLGFLGVAGFFLYLEHQAHLEGALAYLPYLLLIACPLMHLFMHHGHHAKRQPGKDKPDEPK